MKKVTGIGGVFFKCKEPEKIREWYRTHLGLPTDEYGASMLWREHSQPEKTSMTQWSPFPENTDYFKPSDKSFMINYRVENLELLLEELRREGVTIVDEISSYSYGKFVHILDPEGNCIELWEPGEDLP